MKEVVDAFFQYIIKFLQDKQINGKKKKKDNVRVRRVADMHNPS